MALLYLKNYFVAQVSTVLFKSAGRRIIMVSLLLLRINISLAELRNTIFDFAFLYD